MTAPQITTPGTPPDPLAPQPTFRATFYAYLQALVAAFGDANTAFDWVNTTANDVSTNAGTATTQAGIATAKAGEASGSADAAAETAGADQWVSESLYSIGDAVWSPANNSVYRAITNHSGVETDPSADATNWGAVVPLDDYIAKAGDDMSGTLGAHDVDEGVDSLSGTTPSLSVTAAQAFTLTTSGNTTLSVADAPSGRAWVRSIHLTLGGAHTFAITSADWGDDGAPELASGDELKIQLDGIGSAFTAAVSWRATA